MCFQEAPLFDEKSVTFTPTVHSFHMNYQIIALLFTPCFAGVNGVYGTGLR